MCGIAGCGTLTDVTRRMLGYMMWDMERRGTDSWGATNGVDVHKTLGPITETWSEYEEDIFSWDRVILHTRGASVGDVTRPNQHPFISHNGVGDTWKKTVVGIHNGCISNHEELAKKYPDRKFEVDSMHVFEHFAKGLPTSEIYGWGNLAWYEYTPEDPNGSLYLMKFNADNLYTCLLETGEIVFCSVLETLQRAALMAGSKVETRYKIEDEMVYHVVPEVDEQGVWVKDKILKTEEKRVFGTRNYFPVSQHTGPNSDSGWEYWERRRRHNGADRAINITTVQAHARRTNVCGRPGCEKKVRRTRKDYLICDECYSDAFQAVAREIKDKEHVAV